MTVKIVTDSTADLPPDVIDSLGICVVPLTVMFGKDSFLDGETINTGDFYYRLREGGDFPTTSQPSPGQFIEKYLGLADKCDGIVSIHLSSELSQTGNSAIQAVKEIGDQVPRIEVIDSRSVSMGLGLMVISAARAAVNGAGVDEIIELVRDLIGRTHIFVLLDTLEYLRRGGRIGRASAFLGTMLRFHPILTIAQGVVHPIERVRSRSKGILRLQAIAENSGTVETKSKEIVLLIYATSASNFFAFSIASSMPPTI